MNTFHTIYLPKKVTNDILIATFLLQKFGEQVYPGIEKSQIEIVSELPDSKDAWLLEDEGALSLFFKESSFPRGTGLSLSRQVAQKLDITHLFVVDVFISIAEGRAHGELAGIARLLKNVIRQFSDRTHKVYWMIRPILQSQLSLLEKKYADVPEKYTIAFENKFVSAREIIQNKKKLRFIVIESNDFAMIHFLHRHEEINADVVLQVFHGGDIHISACSDVDIDLSDVAALLRMAEIEQKEKDLKYVSVHDLRTSGVIEGVEEWIFDQKNQDIFHKPKSRDTSSVLSKDDISTLVVLGLDGLLKGKNAKTKQALFEQFAHRQAEQLSDSEQERRTERLGELEGVVRTLDKKDISYIA